MSSAPKRATDFSVHDQEGFERVYAEDDVVEIRRGDLRALLDLATGSLDFGSGSWDDEQVEVAIKVAIIVGVDPVLVTPFNFTRWQCDVCRHTSNDEVPPASADERPAGQE